MNERILGNNALISITDIGENNAAVLCMTDKTDCCRSPYGVTAGNWYFPNNDVVGNQLGGGSFYRDRADRVVRLHRRDNVMMPTGLFCCEIPDANGMNQRMCIMVEAGMATPDGV